MVLQLSESQLDTLCILLPDHPLRPKGGRPRTDKRQAIAGIFWILDNGAKWKDLPGAFGTKSSVHRAFQRWVQAGAFEALLAAMGSIIKERRGLKLYECYVDGTSSLRPCSDVRYLWPKIRTMNFPSAWVTR